MAEGKYEYIVGSRDQLIDAMDSTIMSLSQYKDSDNTYPWWIGYQDWTQSELVTKLNFIKLDHIDNPGMVKPLIRHKLDGNSYSKISNILEDIKRAAGKSAANIYPQVGLIDQSTSHAPNLVGVTNPYDIKYRNKVGAIWIPAPTTEFTDDLRKRDLATKTKIQVGNKLVDVSFYDTIEFLAKRYFEVSDFLQTQLSTEHRPNTNFHNFYNKL